MSELGRSQRAFTLAISRLVIFAYEELGVELTCGDAYRDPRLHGAFGEGKGYGSKNSVHKQRLAVDFNLFVDGEYVVDSRHPMWIKLHVTWCSLGGAEMITKDANHFSFEYHGYC